MQDSMITAFKKTLNLENQSDPHEDYPYIATVINKLFKRNRLPMVFHSRYQQDEVMTKDQIMKRYADRFEKSFFDKEINFEAYLDTLLKEETIVIKKDTVMTIVLRDKEV